ncbi:AbiV family abortive infection protein [Aeromicrobium alkaliterrae]
MATRRLPDMTPEQVERLQDALLANADALLVEAGEVLKRGLPALARALAILGMEESGKAIAIHRRRVRMPSLDEGTPFRSDELDDLWANHQKKLDLVYEFLRDEEYWFGVEPAHPDENALMLGSVKRWAAKHDKLKQRGFYVDIDKLGNPLAPSDLRDDEAVGRIIELIHQIGWQLRQGEHIEGKRQDEQTSGVPAMEAEELSWLDEVEPDSDCGEDRGFFLDLRRSLERGTPGIPLRNETYRFNPPGADRAPFRNVGKSGYEALTRELLAMSEELDGEAGT